MRPIPEVNLLAVLVATLVAFVLSAIYYLMLGGQLATVSDAAASGAQPAPWTFGVEVMRTLVVVVVVAGLTSQIGTDEWTGGLVLGTALWIGFPLMLWAGAILHERVPWKLAAIHAGDWLIKLGVVTVIVSVWQ